MSSGSVSNNESESPGKKGTPPQVVANDSAAEHSDDGLHHSPKRSRFRLRRSPEPQSSAEEDLAQLAGEVDEDRILESRLRTRKKSKSTFQQNLEKLKRRKMQVKGKGNIEQEDEGQEEEDASDDDDDPKPFKGSKPSSGLQDDDSDLEQSDTYNSSDFIVEDEASTSVQLPAEFSMETHQDISHQFKKVFQFFVHVAAQPSRKRANFMEDRMQDEQYFSVPLQIVRRKLAGIRDSLVASSVWRPEFKKSLEKYPGFDLMYLDFAVPSCDACHLGGRMSTLLGRLSDSPYNRFGFEALPPRRSDKNELKEFHLGRFCARRTQVYHEFSHWEQSLFHSILREIDVLHDKGSLKSFHTVAFFGGKKPPEDLRDADGLCDWLDERKVIDIEWQKLKKMMESAQHLELGDKAGETGD
ncbi:hypothetical protein CPB84DRAFT_1723119 [Gymnopilus junonius]|uniref:DUF4211 domain-containing protein n=1 Tax=Gymnopilus junonius TaxID=109634 RepID=A0A9P5P0R7_GYMJU|nr:hypothetical protein CPB84DRAFT_1723119 [Gymnopilus junonius]